MASTKTTAWVAGAAVVALAVAAGAWFVAISPTLTDAADQRDAASDQRDHNMLLETQIAKLKEEYTHLDEYRAELASIQTKLPATGDLAELTREVQQVASAAGVTVTVDAPGSPSAFVAPAAPVAATPAPEPSASADPASATDDTGTADTPSAPTSNVVEGLYQIPLSLTSVGTYDQTVAFLDQLQQAMPRLFVVNGLNATSLEAGGAGGGRPATNAGDLEIVISGYVLTLQDSSSAPAAPAPDATATPTPLPVPGDQKNPFQPVGGA